MSSNPSRRFSVRSVLDVLTSVTLVAAAIILIYKNTVASGTVRTEIVLPTAPVSIQSAQLKGSENARVVMIMYSDFQCPFCARFAKEVFPQIQQRYVDNGSVAVAFRHLPLPIHPQARQAAAVAECAGRQGRFWEMHDRLFAATGLTEDMLNALPQAMNLNQDAFDQCLGDRETTRRIEASIADANMLGIRSTPAFLFGTITDDGRVEVLDVLTGTKPLGEFVGRLDATLAGGPRGWRSWVPFV